MQAAGCIVPHCAIHIVLLTYSYIYHIVILISGSAVRTCARIQEQGGGGGEKGWGQGGFGGKTQMRGERGKIGSCDAQRVPGWLRGRPGPDVAAEPKPLRQPL